MKAYHVGASLKDAGKKCFGINLIEDAGIVRDILQRLELETEEQKNKLCRERRESQKGGLRLFLSGKEVGRADCGNDFSDTLQNTTGMWSEI